jgi:hypothetical protein
MTATRLISEADIIPNRAAGYELHGDQLKNQSWVSPTFNSTADGALYFNVLDLAKWDAALYTTKLLKQSSLDQMWTVFPLNNGQPNPGNYGFAWAISRINGHKLIEHDGSWQGFRTQISRYVDDSLTVTVLANIDAARPDHIAQVVAGLADPALDPPKLTPIADNQPELLARLRALLELLASGADVRAQLTPELAKQLAESSPEAAANFASQLKQVWPANSITLVARKLEDGLTISAYRLTKNNETRIVRFALAPDGKIAHLSLHPDPDLR